MLTDGVSCKDAFIINIGVNFDVILLPNFNNSLVLNNIITELTTFFDTDKMQINQPILINNVRNVIDNVEGVQTVKKLEIINKVGINSGYSELAYDIKGATINEVLYPSLDPSIFELKFPETDIQGKVVTN
jgi:phage-related baseplate assembly protein